MLFKLAAVKTKLDMKCKRIIITIRCKLCIVTNFWSHVKIHVLVIRVLHPALNRNVIMTFTV